MSEIETIEIPEVGNIKQPPPSKKTGKEKQGNQLLSWFFTWNNYPENGIETLETKFRKICKSFVFQEEVGKQGTPHLQGVINLHKKMRWTEFDLPPQIFWEKTRNKTAAQEYCQKASTRAGRTISVGMPKPLKLINPDNFYKWQQDCIEIIKSEPDERTIHWFWSEQGRTGKSSFAKYCVHTYHAAPAASGKYSDIVNLIFNTDMDICNCVMFDLPRNSGNEVSYSAIECIKNGMIVNTKYETGSKLFNAPHVFVFANEAPIIEKLSADRWHIVNIDSCG